MDYAQMQVKKGVECLALSSNALDKAFRIADTMRNFDMEGNQELNGALTQLILHLTYAQKNIKSAEFILHSM